MLRARDVLTWRGPDSAGLYDGGNFVFGHRRLAVIDVSAAGNQPWVHERGVLVYNGELYNDADLRRELADTGWVFRTTCDTETVLAALVTWGEGALPRLRGMFALAFFDVGSRSTLLARDAMGIKPLYWTEFEHVGVRHVAFASEIPALLALPGVVCRPDLVTASAYLTTIRTTLGERTMYHGIRSMRPGQMVRIDAQGRTSTKDWSAPVFYEGSASPADLREAVMESVRVHLRADVPTCALLSGGLDSSILCTLAARELPELHTYCSGARAAGGNDDFAFAAEVAGAIGSRHVEAPVSRELFRERWGEMVDALGVPLSTPNEVAISEVARTLRADGRVVTLSGEGADELFGGYEHPLRQALAYERARAAGTDARHPGVFQLDDAAWVPSHAKAAVLNEDVWLVVEQDAALVAEYEAAFEACRREDDADVLDAHLRFQRRINLAGLLGRLDTATMLHGVEGRTPFADVRLAAIAEAMPMAAKFDSAGTGVGSTKVALRRAFAGDLPSGVVARPKASFPLPFREWLPDLARELRGSGFAEAVFTPAAILTVAARPTELWQLAWPMVNLALWGRRFA